MDCSGSGLGWSDGAMLDIRLAFESREIPKFVCAIVGDGAFLMSETGGVYSIAARYGIPFLNVVLNNKGDLGTHSCLQNRSSRDC